VPASNQFQIGIALQTAKGNVVAQPQYMLDVTGSDLGPQPETERRSETGLGVDVGAQFVRVLGAGGSANVLLRPKTAPLLLFGNLGTKAVTGAGPYTHTLTANTAKPWFTVWRSLGGSLWEVFRDCHFTGMNISWEAGGDVTADMSLSGLLFARLTAAPTVPATYDPAEAPFRVPGIVYTVDGGTRTNITEGNINIDWPSTAIQTTAITNSYLEPGAREITASWTEVWEDVQNYAKVYYGSGSGTTAAESRYEATGGFSFAFPHATAGYSLTLTAPRFAFQEATATPDPGGDPLTMPIAGSVERPTGGASILTGTVINGIATYPAVAA
jgi:hypothetical protein